MPSLNKCAEQLILIQIKLELPLIKNYYLETVDHIK